MGLAEVMNPTALYNTFLSHTGTDPEGRTQTTLDAKLFQRQLQFPSRFHPGS